MGTTGWRRAVEEALAAVAGDHRSGAAELVLDALQRWQELLSGIPAPYVEDAARWWAEGLVEAQPSMASFLHLASRLVQEGEAVCWNREALVKRCHGLRAELASIPHRVAGAGRKIVSGAGSILTYSRSSTVLRALALAVEAGDRPRVILSEARPMMEGVDAAREILAMGLRVRMTTDAALAGQVGEVDLVLVGGDALGPAGLLNKVGTRALAAAAREAGVPFYALCGTDKWVPESLEGRIRIRDQDPGEILRDPPDGLEISNPYFDRTPLAWLTGVVSEKGIFCPDEVGKKLEELLST